ncbi:hypothetical protein EJB05_03042, partial [Eragrostis curvula]
MCALGGAWFCSSSRTIQPLFSCTKCVTSFVFLLNLIYGRRPRRGATSAGWGVEERRRKADQRDLGDPGAWTSGGAQQLRPRAKSELDDVHGFGQIKM